MIFDLDFVFATLRQAKSVRSRPNLATMERPGRSDDPDKCPLDSRSVRRLNAQFEINGRSPHLERVKPTEQARKPSASQSGYICEIRFTPFAGGN